MLFPMKPHVLFYLALILFCLPALGGENDTLTVKGIFYLDGEMISIGISGEMIVKIDHLPQEANTSMVYVAPGLIDLQINGFVGVDFADQQLTLEGIREATRALW